jgi:putative DNA primase/helicase
LDPDASPPEWIGESPQPFPAEEVLIADNGLLHLQSYLQGREDCIVPHTPALFSTRAALGYDVSLQAPDPQTWLRFLGQLWPGDGQSIQCMQEWCGYLLTQDMWLQKILLMVGPRRGGKGTIGRVLRRLVGEDNVVSPTLTSLGTQFGLQALLDKSLAIISDARVSRRMDQAAAVEKLLAISGEDAVTVDRKYLSHVTVKLPVRFMILTNELTRLEDVSGALASHFVVLRLTNSWLGKEDPGLEGRLLAELPGILRWAALGWQRLRDRGRLVQPESGRETAEELEHLASPLSQFVKDYCVVGPDRTVVVSDLYEAWSAWSSAGGHEEEWSSSVFGRNLRALIPQVEAKQRRQDGQVVRVYHGIGLVEA